MTAVRVYQDLDELPQAYTALFDKAAGESVFLSLPWYRNFVTHCVEGEDRLRIYVAYEKFHPLPLAVLLMRHSPSERTRFAPRQLMGLSNYYTSLFAPVMDGERDPTPAFRSLVRAIAQDTPRWGVVDLRPLDRSAPCFDGMAEAFRSLGWLVQSYFCFGNWYLSVAGRDYETYFQTLPSALKNTLKRKIKRFEATPGSRIEIVTGGEGLEAAIAAYEKVYRASWKKPEPYPGFVPGLIRTCAEQGWLRLGICYAENEPAAAQVWMVHQGKASIFKLAYDERFSSFSAGTILTARLMEHVIDVDKVVEVDYLTGDDTYKKDWMSHRRERWGLRAFNPRTVTGLISGIANFTGRWAKSMGTRLRKATRRPPQPGANPAPSNER